MITQKPVTELQQGARRDAESLRGVRRVGPLVRNRVALGVTALSGAGGVSCAVIGGWDDHALSHAVAALIFGLLAWTTSAVAMAERAPFARLATALFGVLLVETLLQGVEAGLAVTFGGDSEVHNVVVSVASGLMLLSAALGLVTAAGMIRARRVRRRFVAAMVFLTWWAVMVNFVPYTG